MDFVFFKSIDHYSYTFGLILISPSLLQGGG